MKKYIYEAKNYDEAKRKALTELEVDEKNKTSGIELAKITGVKPPTISSWRKGKKIPKIENIEKIATYYNVPIEYLTSEDNKEETKKYNITDIKNNNNVAIGEKAKIILGTEELEPIDITIIQLIKKMDLEEKAEIIKHICEKQKNKEQ